ncbi:circularly permutated Ras protein 1-like isoform X2 [Lytechinus variegatus]|uniref:circularly permutated Ras protein 1-like isoform X2 n=1 Tax=Lytechinus variegatus TaxID=7654 RepID=UPI001BB19F30|nr:circularly permutated Ras protein 1-like isoform X2 [Lytechinus variegatus]
MDFGSSHIFTDVGSDSEEITAADLQAQYGIYQPLGSTMSGLAVTQADVLYDNFLGDTKGEGRGGAEPIYDNRSTQKASTKSSDYAKPYDYLKRQSHPYEYAGPGSFRGNAPPPLPPMRKKEGEVDPMDDPTYAAFQEGQYQELLRKGSSKIRRADTNIVAVKFDKLVQAENTMTGSPVFCSSNCGAAMSHLSKISKLYAGKCWICEFCETENPVTDDTVVPTTEDSTYVVGPGSGGGADTLVIFCVDVSGSMAVTTEVSGEVSLQGRRSDEQVALQAYQEELDAAEQRSRAAQQEALNAQMLASYQETIEDQAQALAQFQIARTASTASSVQFPPPPSPLDQAIPSAPPGTLPPPSRQPSAAPSVAGRVQGERHSELEERYVAAPQRSFVGSQRQAPPRPPPPTYAATAAPRPAPPPPMAAPEPKKHVSYVSRLQSMQSAIQQQVDKLQAENSHKRVGLVAFNNNVTVIGDGSLDPVPLEGAGLTDRESLISLGQNFPLPGPISEVHRYLTDKIYSLTESGQTALGPALLIAISMAAQKPGSKVIMCTDGMANIGLGTLNDMDNDAAYEEAAKFYDEVGNFARDSGVCVSVLTLEGEDCRAIELGSVADKTRGQVSIVKPNDLNQQFADILADPVLATNVSARMVLHKGLFFRDSENDSSRSQATHNVGLVTADSETTFEFGVRRKEVIYDNYGGTTVVERVEDEPIYESVAQTMIEGLERLPFQVQIRYTGRDGLDYQRILTMDRPVTKDRKFAEQNANVGVIGAHAAQSAAKLAVEGAYAQAQINAVITQKLVQRCTQPEEGQEQEGIYQTFLANMAPIHSEITRAHQLEKRSEEESDDDDVPLVTKNKKISKKMKNRRKNVSDRQASVFYRMKGATTKMFNKQAYSMSEMV